MMQGRVLVLIIQDKLIWITASRIMQGQCLVIDALEHVYICMQKIIPVNYRVKTNGMVRLACFYNLEWHGFVIFFIS